jgi:regulatory protein
MQIIKMKISSSGETYMVSLENGETIKMETETVVKFHLKDEITFTDEEWDEIMSHNSYVATRRRAFNILGYHAQSKKQLYLKLREKADKDTAKAVVEKMVELGLVNDNKLLKEKVRQLLFTKKYGRKRIVCDLSQKGFDVGAINDAINEFECDDVSVICEIIDKKYAQTLQDGDFKTVQKVTAALVRRGFDYDSVKHAISQYTN